MMQRDKASFSRLIRADNWVYSKIPPLLAVGYGAVLVNGIEFPLAFQTLSLLFVCICSVAAYGHIINDIFDIQQDLAAGKKNSMARLSPIKRFGAVFLSIVPGIVVLFLVDFGTAATVLLVLNYLLPTIYSAPPIRLKERGFLGIMADALGSHTVPALFVAVAVMNVRPEAPEAGVLGYAVAVSAALWALFAGLRGIIVHQIADHRNDRRMNVDTFVGSRRRKSLRRMVLRFFLTAEIIGLVSFLAIMLPFSPILGSFVLVYLIGELAKIRFGWKLPLFYPEHPSKEPYLPLLNNEFYEVWLPLALVSQLVVGELSYGVMLILHLVLFRTIIKERLVILSRIVRDLILHLALFRFVVKERLVKIRKLVHDLRESRRARRIDKIYKEGFKVIVGATYWTLNGVNIFSVNLVRGLRERGMDAHILLTEEDCALVQVTEARMQRPRDIPFEELPIEGWRSWGGHWGAMIRYLEDRAPCVYIPNSDWRHSCVIPLLSRKVGIIGVVHSDDPLHYDHVTRLGKYWNAITTTSHIIARKTIDLDSTLRKRTEVIHIGVDIPFDTPRPRENSGRPLKVIYPGILKQYQKRVLDLPKVVSAAMRLDIPICLTIAGGGPDEDQLKDACKELVEGGWIRFLGVVDHEQVLQLLEEHDAFIMTSEFEGMPNALLEAMGRGCVPLVTDMESAVPELVRDGDNGYVVPIGDIDAFAERLKLLYNDSDLQRCMSLKAYEAVSSDNFRVQDMVGSYAHLIERVLDEARRGIYKRPKGILQTPPVQVDGVNIFPVELFYEEKRVGRFPTESRDYKEFKEQIQQLENPKQSPLAHLVKKKTQRYGVDLERLKDVEVIVTSPSWTQTGINDFSADLVRELRAKGISAHILLTEEETELVDITEERRELPRDVPIEHLPVDRSESWGGHWGAMIRYLEDRAPCIYIPNHDWRHSCVSPLLSNDVAIVGIVHGDEPLHLDHVERLGRYWNAIIAVDDTLAQKIQELNTKISSQVSIMQHGAESTTIDYLKVFDRILDEAKRGIYKRPKGVLQPPPAEVDGVSIFPVELTHEERRVGHFPTRSRDYKEFKEQIQQMEDPKGSSLAYLAKQKTQRYGEDIERLKDVEVIFGSPIWTETGINDFSADLVRELRAKGISAHILLTEEETDLVDITEERMELPSDVPIEHLPVDRTESWGGHWGAMIRYLEERAPCIYIPNHDWRHSCVSPLLSNDVAIVGIAHGDEPLHLDHVQRLGRYWNAIIAVNDEVVQKIEGLDSKIMQRMSIIQRGTRYTTRDYLEVFDRILDESKRGIYKRPKGVLQPPPSSGGWD